MCYGCMLVGALPKPVLENLGSFVSVDHAFWFCLAAWGGGGGHTRPRENSLVCSDHAQFKQLFLPGFSFLTDHRTDFFLLFNKSFPAAVLKKAFLIHLWKFQHIIEPFHLTHWNLSIILPIVCCVKRMETVCLLFMESHCVLNCPKLPWDLCEYVHYLVGSVSVGSCRSWFTRCDALLCVFYGQGICWIWLHCWSAAVGLQQLLLSAILKCEYASEPCTTVCSLI